MQRLKISREGVILIKSFEGFRPRAVLRDGQWVIGYGHTLSAREGASVSEADAELLLQYDLIPIAKALNEGVAARLNQHQFDALASFAYSVDLDRFQGSNVLSRLNAGFAGEAADALVGWPEPVLPETSLRRRAAERALFVADPSSAVALSDLLVAPLPSSAPVVAKDEPSPSVAVAAVLSAPSPTLRQTEPGVDVAPTADTETSFAAAATVLAYPGGQAMLRYSAYPGSIVGPLPAPMAKASPVEPGPAAKDDAVESASYAELTEAATEAFAASGAPSVSTTDAPASIDDEPAVNPFPAADTGAVVRGLDFDDTPTTAPVEASAPWSSIAAVHEPANDGKLILTSPVEGDVVAAQRKVWAQEDQATGQSLPMFEDDGAMRLAPGNIIRHEPLEIAPPANIPWGELSAYGLMGAFGLVSFGMSMAAFRRASQATSDADATTMIAIVLAVIGATCVGVAAFNLYRRWGRPASE